MKAIVVDKPAKNLAGMRVIELDPERTLPSDHVRLKMSSSRINPADVDIVSAAMPFLSFKTPVQIGGVDGSGSVIEVGSAVESFKAGDEVIIYRQFSDFGTWAQEITVPDRCISKRPTSVTLEQSGAIALVAATAFFALSCKMNAEAGKSILIHGGSGGVGLQAVQIAKKMGLKVYATAGSSRGINILTNSIGIERVIDYKTEKLDEIFEPGTFDYIYDAAGKEPLSKSIKLKPKILVSVKHPNVDDMEGIGIKLGCVWRALFSAITWWDASTAKKEGVNLLGQVTPSDGDVLAKTAQMIDSIGSDYVPPVYKVLSLDEIVSNGMNGENDLGKVIVF